MVSESQAAHVVALVKERHNAVKQTFDGLLNAYAAGEQAQIITANENLRKSLERLSAVVAAEHWPLWLKDLTLNSDRYGTRHANGLATWRAHLNSAIRNADAIGDETWSFSDQEEVLFDVDAIVAKARAEHQIDDLYEKVMLCLQALLDSGQVDSVRASGDLHRLISTLRNARAGSFSSQVFNWRFARRLAPNIIAAYIKRNDFTGPLIDAFEQTASELDVSLEKAKDQIGTEILFAAASALRTDTADQISRGTLLYLERGPEEGQDLP